MQPSRRTGPGLFRAPLRHKPTAGAGPGLFRAAFVSGCWTRDQAGDKTAAGRRPQMRGITLTQQEARKTAGLHPCRAQQRASRRRAGAGAGG